MNLKEGDIAVDCTTNRAGHSLEIAKVIGKNGTLFCFDLDNSALKEAKIFLEENLSKEKLPKIFYINDNFRNLENVLKENLQDKKVDAILADLGLSSQEIDDSGRGFTFQKDEPLLMTLKDNVDEDALTAEKIVNIWNEENLADIIFYYGDERYARRIAKKICEDRKKKYINTTFDLIKVISEAVPEKYKNSRIHFATKTFQALRMTVNDELKAEEDLLESLPKVLREKGRASIITFHSGEDRIVKNVTRNNKEELKLVKFENKKDFLEPSREEIRENPRSRSAKLRIIEKI